MYKCRTPPFSCKRLSSEKTLHVTNLKDNLQNPWSNFNQTWRNISLDKENTPMLFKSNETSFSKMGVKRQS